MIYDMFLVCKEEAARRDRIRREEQEARDRIRREEEDRKAAEVAARRRTTNRSVAGGATLGFFIAGPLGAAIGAHYGSKHAKERIAQGR